MSAIFSSELGGDFAAIENGTFYLPNRKPSLKYISNFIFHICSETTLTSAATAKDAFISLWN